MTIADFKQPKLELPNGANKPLLHSCCTPCSGKVIEALQTSGVDYTIFFYNPNTHSQKEYLIRKDENTRSAEQHGVPFIDTDYDTDNRFEHTRGVEWKPERGTRCTMYFDMRFGRTALYAAENGFSVIDSSLGISRWRDMQRVSNCRRRTVAHYPDMAYWNHNWRKQGGSSRMIKISKHEKLYQQKYCGCVYSLHNTNLHHKSQGCPLIKIGQLHYDKEERE